VLVDICSEPKDLEEVEKENGWPQRAGKVVLQIALTRLTKHYGLIGDDQHWQDEVFVIGERDRDAQREP